MIYGLYIGNESRPVETGEMRQLKNLVRQMTKKQLQDGWTIVPLDLRVDLPRRHESRNPLWVVFGITLLISTVIIVWKCCST